jgi:hypothetical protein
MTEAEWLACNDPALLIEAIRTFFGRKVLTDRKIRLLACGVVRLLWNDASEERSRVVVEAAEKYADGLLSLRQMSRRRKTAQEAAYQLPAGPGPDGSPDKRIIALAAASAADTNVNLFHVRKAVGDPLHCKLIRDLFPYRYPEIKEGWFCWNEGTILKLAEAIYDDRAFDRLPILADALEEAGCQNAAILGHCRQQGAVHVRGCWVVDVLTGRS